MSAVAFSAPYSIAGHSYRSRRPPPDYPAAEVLADRDDGIRRNINPQVGRYGTSARAWEASDERAWDLLHDGEMPHG